MPAIRSTIRSAARRVALDGLALAGRLSGATDAGVRRPRIHFLYFHDVAFAQLDRFRALLAFCATHGDFASHAGACRALIGPMPPARPIYSLSFDDGFHSCLAASRVMDESGASGCFFVNANAVGLAGEAAAAFCRDRIRTRPTPFLSWDDLTDLRSRGHEIGNHTLDHTDLGAPDRPIDEQIAVGRERIVSRLGSCDHFAWPFGRFSNFSKTARDSVFTSGHATCASAVRGSHVATVRSLADVCVRREHLYFDWPDEHLRYFIALGARRATAADNDWPAELSRGAR